MWEAGTDRTMWWYLVPPLHQTVENPDKKGREGKKNGTRLEKRGNFNFRDTMVVEIGVSKFIYVEQGCLVVSDLPTRYSPPQGDVFGDVF